MLIWRLIFSDDTERVICYFYSMLFGDNNLYECMDSTANSQIRLVCKY